MAAIRSKNTKQEVALRLYLFKLGYRYRLHHRILPGKPDIVFPKYQAVVFVNGCFWHHHECRDVRLPATRSAWWRKKLEGNRRRDMATLKALWDMGWRTVVVWECSIRRKKDPDVAVGKVADRISKFLISNRKRAIISHLHHRQMGACENKGTIASSGQPAPGSAFRQWSAWGMAGNFVVSAIPEIRRSRRRDRPAVALPSYVGVVV